MAYVQRPHVSAALQHLRLGVTASAAGLALALLGQMLIWAFVHFTEVRTTHIQPEAGDRQLKVVASGGDVAESRKHSASPHASSGQSGAGGGIAAEGEPRAAANPNVVASEGDYMLRAAAAIVQTMGIVCAVLLAAFMFQGVIVAGGAAVPGVQMAVSGMTWCLLIALLCFPLKHVMPGAPWTGVFQSFDSLIEHSQAVRRPGASRLGFYLMHLVLPVLLLGGVAAVVLRFRLGVTAGIIVTSISELDEKLEREIRKRGLAELAMPRAMGALNRAIGDVPETVPAGHATAGRPEVGSSAEDEPDEDVRRATRPMMRRAK